MNTSPDILKNMKKLIAIILGEKVTHLDANTRKYRVQYWYKGKFY